MNITIKLKKADMKGILEKSFPEYSGRKFKLEIVAPGTEISLESYWDGGSKSYYKVINDEAAVVANSEIYQNAHPATQHKNIDKITWVAGPATLLIEHSIFCGQDCGIRVTASADSVMIPKNLLAAPDAK